MLLSTGFSLVRERGAESEGNRPPLCFAFVLHCVVSVRSLCTVPGSTGAGSQQSAAGRRFYYLRVCLLVHGDEVIFPALVICVGIGRRWFSYCVFRGKATPSTTPL